MFANKIIKNKSINCNFFGLNNIQPVWASDFDNEIKKCYMGLCLQRKPQLKYCLSDRISQYGGNGLMLFIERETKYYEFLNDKKEAVYFDNVDDLVKKIEYYKDNKNDALNIAESGYNKLHKYCNEKIVTEYFFDCLNGDNEKELKEKYHWPVHFYN